MPVFSNWTKRKAHKHFCFLVFTEDMHSFRPNSIRGNLGYSMFTLSFCLATLVIRYNFSTFISAPNCINVHTPVTTTYIENLNILKTVRKYDTLISLLQFLKAFFRNFIFPEMRNNSFLFPFLIAGNRK